MFHRLHLPIFITAVVFLLLFTSASLLYEGFFSTRVVINLFYDNAFLGIAAMGMTFVILSGGIDLSVGSMIAFSSILVAKLVDSEMGWGLPTPIAMILTLLCGTAFGFVLGVLIQVFKIPPFLATLAGMFFLRGLAFTVSMEGITIDQPFYSFFTYSGIPIGSENVLPSIALIFLVTFAISFVILKGTRFGRNIYAIGGNEASALLMGLPVASTKMRLYAFNGFTGALAGLVASLYTGAGNASMAVGFELDVITAVVIGGTLLTGGVGSLWGTLLGVLILGTIQMVFVFDGRLNSAWLRITMGLLLLLFIVFQRGFSRK